MQVKNFEVKNIILTNLDSKARKLSLQINFSDNTSVPVQLTLEDNFDLLIEKLLKQIKTIKKSEDNSVDDEDFLGSVSIVNIKNEEDIKEKAPKKFYMLDRKLDSFKAARDYKSYMTLYSQFSTIKEIIYEKN